jgi:hypothetical protein
MNKLLYNTLIISIIVLFFASCKSDVPSDFTPENSLPPVFPDYSGVTFPFNIAPPCFKVNAQADNYIAVIKSKTGDEIVVENKSGDIVISENQWNKLLSQNKDEDLTFEVYILKEDKWLKYNPIVNHISSDAVDNYLVYRLINPVYSLWNEIGIYQRDITGYEESAIMKNNITNHNCMNCHTFHRNNSESFMFHMRGEFGGTVVSHNKLLKKYDTKTDYTMSAGVYTSWHPNGKLIAYSVNRISQRFHASGEKTIDVADDASDLIVFDLDKEMVTTSPLISTHRRENMPAWTPDGKYLYFISGTSDTANVPYNKIMYDLMRISYDEIAEKFGNIDTVLLSSNFGKSISHPKISPDGKYLVFAASEYGYFTINYKSSDLYIMDLQTGKVTEYPYNSPVTDSYHSFSSNGKWMTFASKRIDEIFTQVYFTHLSNDGTFSKPFVLPQSDPSFYEKFMLNYNIPEMVTAKVPLSPWKLEDVATGAANPVIFDKNVKVDALSGATYIKKNKESKEEVSPH